MNFSESTIRVRYAETDQMGVVYHSNYYIWFEVARTDLLRKLSMTYKDMEQNGIILPVIETHCRYKIPAMYDDFVTIKAEIEEVGGVKITFSYTAFRQSDGVLLAEGKTVHVFADFNKKPVNIKKKNPALYEEISKVVV